MTLALATIDPRESPVALLWAFDADPWLTAHRATIEHAAERIAATVSRPDVPVLSVRVEAHTDGALADGRPYTWPGGARIRFDATSPQWGRGVSVAAVAEHEITHVLGVVDHSGDWLSLVSAHRVLTRPLGEPSASDAASLEAVGWAVRLPEYTEATPYAGPLLTVPAPWGEGWVRVPPRVAEAWAKVV